MTIILVIIIWQIIKGNYNSNTKYKKDNEDNLLEDVNISHFTD